MGQSRRGGRSNIVAEMMQSMELMSRMKDRDLDTEERKRRNLEVEDLRGREVELKEGIKDEKEIERRFTRITGLPLDAGTRQYATPIEEHVRNRATLRSNAREQPQEYEEQNFLEKLTRAPKIAKPKMGYTSPELDEETIRQDVDPKIRSAGRMKLEALGFIGEGNRDNPNFDESIHDYFMSSQTPLVHPDKVLDKVKDIQEQKKLRAITRQESTKAEIGERTKEDIIEQQGTLATQKLKEEVRKGVIEGNIKAWEDSIAPQKEADRLAEVELKRKLDEAKVANIPREIETAEANLKSIRANTLKTEQEIAKHRRKSELAEMWNKTTDPKKKNDLARQILVEDGNIGTLMSEDRQISNDAVRFSMENSKAIAQARKVQAMDPTNIAEIDGLFKTANLAAIRSATLTEQNLVTIYNVKSDPGYGIKAPTAQVESVTLGLNYALAKQQGRVTDYIYPELPAGLTPKEMTEKVYPGQAAMLGWSLIDNYPGLRGNIAAFDAKVDTIPGINPEVKVLAKAFMAKQMGIEARKEQDRATLGPVKSGEAESTDFGQGELTQGKTSTFKAAPRSKTIYGRPEDEKNVTTKPPAEQRDPATLTPKKIEKETPKIDKKESKKSPEETDKENLKLAAQREQDSPVVRDVKADVMEVFRSGKRFKYAKDATFPEWVAEQAARVGADPSNYTAKDFTGFWNSYNKAKQ